MQFPLETQVVEVRVDEEDRILARVSEPTLRYMHDYGVALEGWLRHHHGNLEFLAEEERDLFEGMRLTRRLERVEGNITRTGRRNERIRAELMKRELLAG